MNVPGLRFLLEREVRTNAIEARATRAERRRKRRRRQPRLPLNTGGKALTGRKREAVNPRIPKSQEKRNRRAILWRTTLIDSVRDRPGKTEKSPFANDRAGSAHESPFASAPRRDIPTDAIFRHTERGRAYTFLQMYPTEFKRH